jgi:hypothetical protein
MCLLPQRTAVLNSIVLANNSIEEGIWNRVWAFTDDGRPLELAKLDVAVVPRVHLK